VNIGAGGGFTAGGGVDLGIQADGFNAGDLNGDGLLDAAVVGDESVVIAINDGANGWASTLAYEMLLDPRDVEIADFDGDGALDVAVSGLRHDEVAVRFGDGTGALGSRVDVYMEPGWLLEVGDINGDGMPDLLSGSRYRLGRGDRTFEDPVVDGDPNSRTLVMRDFNQDGLPDVAGTSTYGGSLTVSLNAGDDFLSRSTYGTGTYLYAKAADLNDDGVPDLIASGANRFDAFLNDGAGGFAESDTVTVSGLAAVVAVADLTGDGAVDVVACNSSNTEIEIHPGNGDGTFGSAQTAATSFNCYEVGGVADMDHDGAPDVITLGSGSNTMEVLYGSATARAAPSSVAAIDSGGEIAFADMDGDGLLDAVAGDGSSLDIYPGLGDGTFDTATSLALLNAERTYDIAVADFNGDGYADVVGDANSAAVGVFLNNGDGTLSKPTATQALARNPMAMTAIDFDRDGHTDVVVAQGSSDKVEVFTGNGDGTLNAAVEYDVAWTADRARAGDLDNDGAVDIHTARTVMWGDGDGTFTPATINGAGDQGQRVADIDGDGWADLLGCGGERFAVALNAGDRSFGSNQSTSLPGFVNSIAVGHMDGDGELDVVLGDRTNNDLLVMLGNGDTTFERVTFPSGNNPLEVDLIDLDADGATDVALRNSSDSTVGTYPMGLPGTWRRTHTTDALARPSAAPGATLNLTGDDVEHLLSRAAVSALLEWDAQPTGTVDLSLEAPDGQTIALTTIASFDAWQSVYRAAIALGEGDTTGDLTSLYGEQPRGTWTLSIDNQTDLDLTVVDWKIVTRAGLHVARPGQSADVPQDVLLPSGTSSRLMHGWTTGSSNAHDASCGGVATSTNPETWYEITLPAVNDLTLTVDAAFDAVIDLRNGSCASSGTQIDCDDNSAAGEDPTLTATSLAAGSYCIIVDGDDDTWAHHGEHWLWVDLGTAIP
jgi:hypothetical protein